MQNREDEAESRAGQSERAEQHRLEGDHEARRRVSVRAAERLQPGRSHDGGEEGEKGEEEKRRKKKVGYGVRRDKRAEARRERKCLGAWPDSEKSRG